MRFTLAALAACPSFAARPELGRVSVSKRIASVGDIMSKISSPSDSLSALKETSSLLNGILAEQEPSGATDHISEDDAELLSSVITLVEKTIYSSMDDAHEADVAALDNAIETASSCNADIAQRQSPDGDLGHLHQAVQDKQTELNRLQGVVDDKTEANNTAYDAFDSHNQMIAPAPACQGLPARTMPALDMFFDESEYVIWYTAQQSAYIVVRDAFVAADKALEAAIEAYEIQRAVRDTQYCDWKSELEAACAAFDVCFSEATEHYTNELVPSVTSRMNGRIEIKKAGDTVVHQIQFLLGQAEDQATPEIDTSRYEIAFPDLPAKGLCDLSPLDADEWVPTVQCSPASFAGTYQVWYRGERRSGQVMNIGCDNSMNGHGGSSQLQFDGVGAICDQDVDASATMFSVGLHGANKHECYSVDGGNIVGNHYVNNGEFWGSVEYRLISSTRCA